MPQLIVDLTQDQYDRYKIGFKQIQGMEMDPTDEQLTAQLKREAAAITYAAEVGNGNGSGWTF
ncbi:hypothetical protein [Nitrosomonas sp. Nm166]|uniref:hypothetical protein n=1 Tax=Nitrosomonas sp. Nm166 TaxID=1881054 RepID=UPI0008ED13C1|nr:hypothetical protein [Nitrosomonas sp. Nm166]SFF13401.1 hypothetical protein SAMN05428977_10546 [Nitrosomonas sp. Nm166]